MKHIIVSGPAGCGKTHNVAKLKKHFGAEIANDGWHGDDLMELPSDVDMTFLYLTNRTFNDINVSIVGHIDVEFYDWEFLVETGVVEWGPLTHKKCASDDVPTETTRGDTRLSTLLTGDTHTDDLADHIVKCVDELRNRGYDVTLNPLPVNVGVATAPMQGDAQPRTHLTIRHHYTSETSK